MQNIQICTQTAGRQYTFIIMTNKNKKQEIINDFKKSLKQGFYLKSTTPIQKNIEGIARYTMWVEDEHKRHFLIYKKNNGDLKYLPEDVVKKMRDDHTLTNIK